MTLQRLADRIKPMVPKRTAKRIVRARLRARVLTGSLRGLPDFLIVGGMRCGTSSLYKWLGHHPSVVPSLRKEIHYLSIDHAQGERWYRAHFPLRLRIGLARVLGRRLQTFEATPDYLFLPHAAVRAARLMPDARIIALIRNPVDRAISHYHHMVRIGKEPLGLQEALFSEEERLAGEWAHLENDPDYPCLNLRRYSYVARGFYAQQLDAWAQFYPRARILVVKSDDLYRHPAETYQEVLRFLDLPPWEPGVFRNYSYVRDEPEVRSEATTGMRDWLAERFEAPNLRLAEWLGRDPGW